MKHIKKIVALILALCISATLASCNGNQNNGSSDTKSTASSEESSSLTSSGADTQKLMATLADAAPVMTVNGKMVSALQYNLYYQNIKNNHEIVSTQQDSSFWNSANSNDINVTYFEIENAIRYIYAVDAYAKKLGFTLTDKSKAAVKKRYDEKVSEQYGDDTDALTADLTSGYFTEELYLQKEYDTQLYSDLFLSIYGDKVFDYICKNYVCAKQILIYYTDDTKDSAKKKINEVKGMLDKGSDYDELLESYGEDTGLNNLPQGYYFEKGDMTDEFYNAVVGLTPGTYSDVIDMSNGSKSAFTIIKRLDLDFKYIKSNLATLAPNSYTSKYANTVEKLADKLKVTYTDEFYKYFSLNGKISAKTMETAYTLGKKAAKTYYSGSSDVVASSGSDISSAELNS